MTRQQGAIHFSAVLLLIFWMDNPISADPAQQFKNAPQGQTTPAVHSSVDQSKVQLGVASRPPDGDPKSGHSTIDLLKNMPDAENWELVANIKLPFDTWRPQGLKKVGDRFFMTSVDKEGKAALLLVFSLEKNPKFPSGYRVIKIREMKLNAKKEPYKVGGDAVTIDEPRLIQAGGLDYDGENLVIPVSEYDNDGPTIIQTIHPETMTGKKRFAIQDHVGSVICDRENKCLKLIDWDVGIYTVPWKTDGQPGDMECLIGAPKYKPIKGSHPSGQPVEYQDGKYVKDGYVLCSGKYGKVFVDGYLDLLKFGITRGSVGHGYEVIRSVKAPHLNRVGGIGDGRPLTYNPFDFEMVEGEKGKELLLYMAPHDNPTHLFIYRVK